MVGASRRLLSCMRLTGPWPIRGEGAASHACMRPRKRRATTASRPMSHVRLLRVRIGVRPTGTIAAVFVAVLLALCALFGLQQRALLPRSID